LNPRRKKTKPQAASLLPVWLFPGIVFIIYAVLFAVLPGKTITALKSSGNILARMALPLGLVFVVMVLMNLFLRPGKITEFLGEKAGIKGLLLSAAAGIISIGPIYAWYPLLKDLREKGASNSLMAVFLCNRSVKPFLLPVMVSYFGWTYVLFLTFFTVLAAIAVGTSVGVLTKE